LKLKVLPGFQEVVKEPLEIGRGKTVQIAVEWKIFFVRATFS
jgi:hypothetical protein